MEIVGFIIVVLLLVIVVELLSVCSVKQTNSPISNSSPSHDYRKITKDLPRSDGTDIGEIDASDAQIGRQNHEDEAQKRAIEALSWLRKYAQLFTFFVTAAAVVIYGQQLASMNGQLDAANKQLVQAQSQASQAAQQMRIDERAWVELSLADDPPKFAIEANKPLIVKFNLKNMGRTVARDIRGFIVIEKLPIDVAPTTDVDVPMSAFNFRHSVLFPNGTPWTVPTYWVVADYDHAPTMHQKNVTQADVDDWNSDDFYFAVHGQIGYVDIFNVDHWQKFCHVFRRHQDRPIPQTFGCIGQYNAIDENME